MSRRASRLAEVRWGEGEESPILRRWMAASPRVRGADRVIRSRPAQDWDYLALDRRGIPIAYIEIKKRRIALAEFGDAMCPIRKHELARDIHRVCRLPFVMVVSYACGTLVEIDLLEPPAERRDVKRHDRDKHVPHGLWKGDQLVVIPEYEEAA